MRNLLSLLSLLFILCAPILLGGLFPVVAMKYGVPGDWALIGYGVYTVVYFWIWADYLDEGRKLTI